MNNSTSKEPEGKKDLKIPRSKKVAKKIKNTPETLHLIYGSATSVGLERTYNEDSLVAVLISKNDGQTKLDFGAFILADGMGGHSNGEVASASAVNCAFEYLMKIYIESIESDSVTETPEVFEKLMEDMFSEAQQTVLDATPGGGTTMTVALCINNLVIWGHVGDSRLLHLTQGNDLNQITKDHSLVGRLVELGQISELAAENHPQKNVLIRALGQTDGFRVDVGHFYLKAGEELLLCSDGLWGSVPKALISKTMQADQQINRVCESLVDIANDHGGPDNISVIIVKYQ